MADVTDLQDIRTRASRGDAIQLIISPLFARLCDFRCGSLLGGGGPSGNTMEPGTAAEVPLLDQLGRGFSKLFGGSGSPTRPAVRLPSPQVDTPQHEGKAVIGGAPEMPDPWRASSSVHSSSSSASGGEDDNLDDDGDAAAVAWKAAVLTAAAVPEKVETGSKMVHPGSPSWLPDESGVDAEIRHLTNAATTTAKTSAEAARAAVLILEDATAPEAEVQRLEALADRAAAAAHDAAARRAHAIAARDAGRRCARAVIVAALAEDAAAGVADLPPPLTAEERAEMPVLLDPPYWPSCRSEAVAAAVACGEEIARCHRHKEDYDDRRRAAAMRGAALTTATGPPAVSLPPSPPPPAPSSSERKPLQPLHQAPCDVSRSPIRTVYALMGVALGGLVLVGVLHKVLFVYEPPAPPADLRLSPAEMLRAWLHKKI